MRLRLTCVLPLLLIAACDGHKDHASTGGDALAGHWSAVGKLGELTVGIEFDGKGGNVVAHIDGPDGHMHSAKDTTYTFDAATKKVTIKGKLLGSAKENAATEWAGSVNGDTLELVGGTDKITVKKGGKAH